MEAYYHMLAQLCLAYATRLKLGPKLEKHEALLYAKACDNLGAYCRWQEQQWLNAAREKDE